jgi:hypothetical protein
MNLTVCSGQNSTVQSGNSKSPKNSLNGIDPSISNIDRLFKYSLCKVRIEIEIAE